MTTYADNCGRCGAGLYSHYEGMIGLCSDCIQKEKAEKSKKEHQNDK